MAPSPEQREPIFGRILGSLGARYMRFVCSTSEVIVEPADMVARGNTLHPFVFAMWHGQFVLMPTLHEINEKKFKVSAIAAKHKDASPIRVLLRKFDIEVVEGAGANERKADKGGARALRVATRLLKSGSTFSMTADIPPGPSRKGGIGIVMVGRYSGRPIVPLAVATSRFIVLPTWSRMTINLPYSKLAYVMGEPIWIAADADAEALEASRRAVETGLNRVTERAYALVGADIARVSPPRPDAAAGPAPVGLALKSYRGATRAFGLVTPLLLGLRTRQGKEDAARRGERYGETDVPRPEGSLMWFHAASVGEANAVLPVIEQVLKERDDVSVLLTTGTLTSAAMAKRRLPSRALHQYVVLDVPAYVTSFLDHWKPDVAVFAESEIWPNLILDVSRRKVPLALINARMSARSATRWRWLSGISKPLFSRFDLILSQNDAFARTLKRLGARRVLPVGNLKIDAPPPVVDAVELERLRQVLAGRPLMVAASTHDPEEMTIADAHRLIASELKGFCTIIAPRHPGRGKAVADALRAKGFKVALKSTGEQPDAATDIYVVDAIGELGTLFALTDIAFIGGSLIPHGGQNPVEAIGHGAVVLTGPNWTNFRDLYRALLRHKGACEVANAEALAAAVKELLTQEGALAEMRTGAKTALSSLTGALEKTVTELIALLPESARVRRAS